MHTYSNRTIDHQKIALLKIDDNYSVNYILISLIEKDIKYIKIIIDFYMNIVFIFKIQKNVDCPFLVNHYVNYFNFC